MHVAKIRFSLRFPQVNSLELMEGGLKGTAKALFLAVQATGFMFMHARAQPFL
jgi:hypothetical protein